MTIAPRTPTSAPESLVSRSLQPVLTLVGSAQQRNVGQRNIGQSSPSHSRPSLHKAGLHGTAQSAVVTPQLDITLIKGRHRRQRKGALWRLGLSRLGLTRFGAASALLAAAWVANPTSPVGSTANASTLATSAIASSSLSAQDLSPAALSLPVQQPLLRYGMRGPSVKAVQRALLVTPRSGYFGPRTLRAVRTFQARQGLAADGVVGPRTWAALGYGSTSPGVVSPMRPGTYRISGRYYASGGPWSGRKHKGLDFAAPRGTRVSSVAKGRIVDAGWAGGCGYRVVVEHPSGTHTWYCHLYRISRWSGTVKAGYKLGEVGATGHATGNHLHFEVRLNGVTSTNPVPWLANRGVAV